MTVQTTTYSKEESTNLDGLRKKAMRGWGAKNKTPWSKRQVRQRAKQSETELEFLLELEACQQTLARRRERLRGIVPVEGAGNHLLMLVRD